MRTFLLLFLVLGTFAFQSRTNLTAQEAESLRAGKEGEVELLFSHQYHIDDEGLACDDCHDAVDTSKTGRDNLMPTHATCEDCHDVEDEETCSTCHTDAENPRIGPRIVDYSIPFSHEKHVGAEVACETCHATVAQKTAVGAFDLPAMVACMDCHDHERVEAECETCHTPGERLTPRNHAGDFRHTHGDLARTQALTSSADKTCQTCHSDDFCQDCHEGDDLDRINHPINFAFTHALQAQSNAQDCMSCHTDRQFCTDCHTENQVMPHTHRPGWANRLDGGRHRLEAMSDIESCMSCHETDADRVCQPCHGNL